MTAPIPATSVVSTPPGREIPYNYTSFSDKEIVGKLLGKRAWEILQDLSQKRETGISSHMLLEMLGDMWMVIRNPYIQDDLLENPKRQRALMDTLKERLARINARAKDNPKTLELLDITRQAVSNFGADFEQQARQRATAKRRLTR
ncbi:MAG: DUF3683 domain-containing protein, partial [Thiothrix sp.]|nr:DUF3683 domain-containing protein [Thiothrix sp.]